MDFTCAVTPVGTAYCWGRNAAVRSATARRRTGPTPAAVCLPPGRAVRLGERRPRPRLRSGARRLCSTAGDPTVRATRHRRRRRPRTRPRRSSHRSEPQRSLHQRCRRRAVHLRPRHHRSGVLLGAELRRAARQRRERGLRHANPRPLEVQGGPFDVVSAFRGHACALTDVGFAVCWGNNATGQLGRGGPTGPGRLVPAQISGSRRFSAIAAGDGHACAIGLARQRAGAGAATRTDSSALRWAAAPRAPRSRSR